MSLGKHFDGIEYDQLGEFLEEYYPSISLKVATKWIRLSKIYGAILRDNSGFPVPSSMKQLEPFLRWSDEPTIAARLYFKVCKSGKNNLGMITGDSLKKALDSRNSPIDCNMNNAGAYRNYEHAWVVYFMRCGLNGPVKIGISSDVERRKNDIQASTPETIIIIATLSLGSNACAARKLERHLHAKFNRWRIRGEWFHPCEELMQFIASETADRKFLLEQCA